MRPRLNGPDGVLAVARPEGAAPAAVVQGREGRSHLMLMLWRLGQGHGMAFVVVVVVIVGRHGLGLEHDGALGLVD